MPVYLNVTTSWNWRRPPVGIVRVERELLAHLAASSTAGRYCVLDRAEGTFRQLADADVMSLLSDSWCTILPGSPATKPARGRLHVAAKRAFRVLPSTVQEFLRGRRDQLRRPAAAPPRPLLGSRIAPTPQDCFVSIGLDWDYGLDVVAALKRDTQVSVVLGCYDTIPIDYPEVSSKSTRHLFEKYFLRVASVADRIFAISETSKRDLEAFYRRNGLAAAPPITAITLGSGDPRTARSAGAEVTVPNSAEGFILYVSTIEARKNHRILIQVWRDLHSRYGHDIPTLVLVGMPGWGVRDLLEEVESMAVFRAGFIRILNRASDDQLALLYRKCLFAVFPSMYEGWGLGAVEAMRYGKVCLVSDAPALVEATQGLCPTLHPLDFLGWRDAIVRYWKSQNARELMEVRIKSSFRVRTWREFGRDFELFLAQA